MSTDNVATRHHAHHFRDADHEFESSKFGVWLFMATEILMFGGLFVGYFIFQAKMPETFAEGAKFLDWKMGAINTVVLLFSSFTMALSIHFAQKNNTKACVTNLALTVLCGAIFMVIKYFEYTHKFHLGIFPGLSFSPTEEALGMINQVDHLSVYFSFYFCMTGLHGLHVIIGMSLITWVLLRARKGEFNENYYTPIEGVGLFWHVVDLVWIYLFPILYLIK